MKQKIKLILCSISLIFLAETLLFLYPNRSLHLLLNLVEIATTLYVGFKIHQWLEAHLLDQGHVFQAALESTSAYAAVAQVRPKHKL